MLFKKKLINKHRILLLTINKRTHKRRTRRVLKALFHMATLKITHSKIHKKKTLKIKHMKKTLKIKHMNKIFKMAKIIS